MNIYDQLWAQDWQTLQVIGPLTHTRYRLMLNGLPAALPKDSRIIDVGCGNGTFLEILNHKYPDINLTGIEFSSQAQELAPPHLQKSIKVGDIVELAPQLPKQAYDVVICSEVLEHVVDPEQVLKVIVSLLKPTGRAIFTVPGGMRYWSNQDEIAGHYRRFEYEEFATLIQRSGLNIVKHYGWGGPFGLIYNSLVSAVGPQRVMQSKNSWSNRLISKILLALFRIDDLFCSRHGFQLVTITKVA